MKQKEVDFIALKGTEKIYIQVAQYIIEESTKEREFGKAIIEITKNSPLFDKLENKKHLYSVLNNQNSRFEYFYLKPNHI